MSQLSLTDIITASDDPEEIFEILDLLGEGNYGKVYKALHKPTGYNVAVKIVPQTEEINSLKKEIMILKECQSNYIVKYYGSYFKDNSLWLIIEYCAAGSVIDLIKITKKQLNETEISCILNATLYGLEYLHQNKKIHRDIKAGNILLDQQGNAKLADFGISAELNHTQAYKDTVIGTPFWMSPEVIKNSKYNFKTDIWSLGITAIELAEGGPPYSHLHPYRAMFAIQNRPPKGLMEPDKWSPEFNNFVTRCLQYDPEKRPSSSELLQDQFILKHKQKKAILIELVINSMDEIERYRINQIQKKDNEKDNNHNNSQDNEMNTLQQKENNFFKNNDRTVLDQNLQNKYLNFDQENYDMEEDYYEMGEIDGNTMVEKKDQDIQAEINKYAERNFVDVAKEMEENNILPQFKQTVQDQERINSNLENLLQDEGQIDKYKQIINSNQQETEELSNLDLISLQNKRQELEDQMQKKIQEIKESYQSQIDKYQQYINKVQSNTPRYQIQNQQQQEKNKRSETYQELQTKENQKQQQLLQQQQQQQKQQYQQQSQNQQDNQQYNQQQNQNQTQNKTKNSNQSEKNKNIQQQNQIKHIDQQKQPYQQENQVHQEKKPFICHDLRKVYPKLIDSNNYQEQQQIQKNISNENKAQLYNQLSKLPFNFQVDQQLLDKLKNLSIHNPDASNSKHLKSNQKNLPFLFIPQVDSLQSQQDQFIQSDQKQYFQQYKQQSDNDQEYNNSQRKQQKQQASISKNKNNNKGSNQNIQQGQQIITASQKYQKKIPGTGEFFSGQSNQNM